MREHPSTAGRRGRRVFPALAAALLLASCNAPGERDEPWTYALSRGFYPSLGDSSFFVDVSRQQGVTSGCSDASAALVLLAVFALPFALDTVFLPVTLTHDVIARR